MATADEIQNPDNLVELAALERMIQRSDGFRISFAVANHPALRARLTRAVRRDLPGYKIADLTIPEAPATLVAEIENAAQPPLDAVFVFGLDELGSDQDRSRVIAELNLNRDHLWRAVPVPVVLWASDFAVRQFAQLATDLWSGRSGVYRFHAEGDDNASTVADITSGINWESTPDARREREALLHDLLDESDDDTAARARLLVALGDTTSVQHRYDEARGLYEQALRIHRDTGDRLSEANTLRSLGDTALAQNHYQEARELYEKALPIHRDIGDRFGETKTLRSLGDAAHAQNRYDEPREPIEESVPSARCVPISGRGSMGTRIFVSHAGADLALASELRRWLVEDGHEVFLGADLCDGISVDEQWAQQLIERLRQTDVVICLVTSAYLASPWCTAEVAIAQSRGNRLLPVSAEPSLVHPLLKSVHDIDMTRDLVSARAELAEVLRRVKAAGGSGWPEDHSPFPGLRPFDINQHRVFFGRTDEVGQLAGLLRSAALPAEGAALLVVGPSGCGKSSLVRAGLLPVMFDEPGWRTLRPIVPGDDPVVALARELTAAARWTNLRWTAPHVHRRLNECGLTVLAEELLMADPSGPQRRLLVVVDQFEELLTRTGPVERARFAKLLRPALTGPVQLVTTLRPEFLDQLLADPELAALPTYAYPLRPLRREALRAVIEGPARLAGIDVDEHLVARLIDDTDSGEALPLLAFTLAQLADGVGRGGQLSSQRYNQLGGVQGALTRQADAALADAVMTGGRSREQVIDGLLRLVTVDEQGRPTRWRVNRSELPGPVAAELDAFVARRLLSTDTDNDTVVIGVAHEAFLSAWPPLAEAIKSSASALRARRAVEHAATEWNDNGRPLARLWGGGQLAAAVIDTGDRVDLSPNARDFLQAGIRRDRYRRARVTTVLSVLLVLAVTLAGIAVVQQRAAQEQRRVATARQLTAQAEAARDTDPRTALLLGLAAQHIHPSGETDASLVNTLTTTRYAGTLTGHTGPVYSVAFSPVGTILATAGEDDKAILWDFTNRARPRPLGPPLTGHKGQVNSVVFAPNGTTLATASTDSTVILWDVTNPAQSRPLGLPLTGHRGQVNSVVFAPNGTTLATASDDGTVILWDVTNPAQSRPLGPSVTTGTVPVRSVAFAPDGRTLATGRTDGTVILWDVTDPTRPYPLAPPLAGSPVLSVAFFAPDGRILATGSSDNTVILWDLTNPAQPHPLGPPLTGHHSLVNSVAFAPDGTTLATGSSDNTVILWNLTNPAQPHPLGPPLTGHHSLVNSMTFAANGTTLTTGSSDNETIQWDLTDRARPVGRPGQSLKGFKELGELSPDRRVRAIVKADYTVILRDVTDPTQPRDLGRPLAGHTGPVHSLAFDREGHTLATGSTDNTVILWDVTNPAEPRRLSRPLTGHTGTVYSLAFDREGRTLATGSTDNTVILWDVTNPAEPRRLGQPLARHTGTAGSVAFSPDGNTLATGSSDGTVVLWDLTGLNDLRNHVTVRACSITGSGLDRNEWASYVPGLPYQNTCPT